MYPELGNFPYVAIDVETKGLDWKDDYQGVFGIAIATPDGNTYYFDVRKDPGIIDHLNDTVFQKIVNHNMKFDLHMLHSLGVHISPNICECTMVRASLINENLFQYSLDSLAKRYLKGQKKISDIYPRLAELFGGRPTRKAQIVNLHKAPIGLVADYAMHDAFLALKLWEYQEIELKKQKLQKVWQIEKSLFPVVYDMERRGVKIDVASARGYSNDIEEELRILQNELSLEAGFQINCNASSDLIKLFEVKESEGVWKTKDGTILTKTPKGNPQLNKEALDKMTSPLAKKVKTFKQLYACKNTFLDNHILSHVTEDGYVHPNINQTRGEAGGTVTGRFSITRPALQQIPSRDKNIASMLRPLFLPDEDHIWYCFDYEQFEFRMFAHYVNDPNINKTYLDNPAFDFHQMVADLTGLPRNAPEAGGANAKTVNLGMLYDMGGGLLAKTMSLPYEEDPIFFPDKKAFIKDVSKLHAVFDICFKTLLVIYVSVFKQRVMMMAGNEAQEVMSKYYSAIPGVKDLAERTKTKAKERGFITSIGGRKLRFMFDFHKAKARLCQGSSADCMKVKLIEIYNLFLIKYPKCRIYLSVHDEFNIGMPKSYSEDKKDKCVLDIIECLCGFSKKDIISLRVPIMTDHGKGENWGVASGKG